MPDTVTQESPEQVMDRLIGELAASAGVAMTLLGIRLGLWRALAERSPRTAAEVAVATSWPSPSCGSGCAAKPRVAS